MFSKQTAVSFNRQAWDRMAEAGDRLYLAVTPKEIAAARQGKLKIRLTPTKTLPESWLSDIAGRQILCLAGGGARQGPLLAAAGASVTVFDLSQQQLQRDRDIANREKLDLKTVAGDMRDLSHFGDRQFDLIISPCATCFCPETQPIWDECFRVLRTGGILMIGMINPIHYLMDAAKLDKGQFEIRHPIPYSDFDLPDEERNQLIGSERPIEFGHSLEQLIAGQLEAGFKITGFFEDAWGGNDPLSKKINTFLCTRSQKP